MAVTGAHPLRHGAAAAQVVVVGAGRGVVPPRRAVAVAVAAQPDCLPGIAVVPPPAPSGFLGPRGSHVYFWRNDGGRSANSKSTCVRQPLSCFHCFQREKRYQSKCPIANHQRFRPSVQSSWYRSTWRTENSSTVTNESNVMLSRDTKSLKNISFFMSALFCAAIEEQCVAPN